MDDSNHGPAIFCPATPREYQDFQVYYDHLAFVTGNRWAQLLRGGLPGEGTAGGSMPPVVERTVSIPDDVLLALIRETQLGLSETDARKAQQ